VEGFGWQGNRLRPTPETGVVRIEAKVSEAPLGGGHPQPPLLPLGGQPRPRGVKAHDTTAAGRRHGKKLRTFTHIYSIFTLLLRYLYDLLPAVCHTPQRQSARRLCIEGQQPGAETQARALCS